VKCSSAKHPQQLQQHFLQHSLLQSHLCLQPLQWNLQQMQHLLGLSLDSLCQLLEICLFLMHVQHLRLRFPQHWPLQ
jgi:hypothetical protein